jgi:hypothetical protein
MYHPKVGTRSTGGVVTYVRELLAALPRGCPAVLYTADGSYSAASNPSVDVFGVPSTVPTDLDRVPFDVDFPVQDVGESVGFFANAVLDGALAHIRREVDILFAHGGIDSALLSTVADTPVVRVYHGVERTSGMGRTLLDHLTGGTTAVANSQWTARAVTEQLGRDVAGVRANNCWTGSQRHGRPRRTGM